MPQANTPILRHILNLWTLVGHPAPAREWSLEQKVAAVGQAGFDGFMDRLTPAHAKAADRLQLLRVGYFRSSKPAEFRSLLQRQRDCGAVHVNVHLGEHDTPTNRALEMAIRLHEDAAQAGVLPSIEVHRDTATETPEKTTALADAFQAATGELLPLTWDHSHLAVVKHVMPPYWERLGLRPDLIQRSQQFHFRPFNGHHCQVPVFNRNREFSPEFRDYLPFMEQVLQTWLAAAPAGREVFILPELGPTQGGYALHVFPSSWAQAKVLRGEIQKAWDRALKKRSSPKRPKS